MVKNLPAMQEMQVWSLNWEDPLKKGMTAHSSILAWRIPRTKKPGGPQSMGSQRVGHNWVTNTSTLIIKNSWKNKLRYTLHSISSFTFKMQKKKRQKCNVNTLVKAKTSVLWSVLLSQINYMIMIKLLLLCKKLP